MCVTKVMIVTEIITVSARIIKYHEIFGFILKKLDTINPKIHCGDALAMWTCDSGIPVYEPDTSCAKNSSSLTPIVG